MVSGMCGLSLEVTDLRVEPLESVAVVSSDAAAFFCSVKKFRMATHVLERREQLRPVLKAGAFSGGGEPPARRARSGSARAGAADS